MILARMFMQYKQLHHSDLHVKVSDRLHIYGGRAPDKKEYMNLMIVRENFC